MQSLLLSTQQMILQLIRESLYAEEYTVDNDSNIDWHSIYNELEQQTVSCMVAGVLNETRYVIPAELRDTWMARIGLNISSFHRILSYQDEAIKILTQIGIPVVVLKGAVSALNYPKPEYRIMGDIDLLVPEECFDDARKCFFQLGYQPVHGEDENIRPSAKHFGMCKDGIVLELHVRAFQLSESKINVFLNQYMIEGLRTIEWKSLAGYEFPSLPMVHNALELLLHVQEHLTGAGIGLRQVVDWMLFAEYNLSDDKYEHQLKPLLKQVGLEKFAQTLTRMCQVYLGLPEAQMQWCMDADEKLCAALMHYILQQGNFGHKNPEESGVRAFERMRHPGEFIKKIQSVGLANHPQLRDKKVLQYFAWVPQLGRYIKYTFSKNTNLREDYKAGKKKSDLFGEMQFFKTDVVNDDVPGEILVAIIREVLHSYDCRGMAIRMDESSIDSLVSYARNQGLYMFLQEHVAFCEYLQTEKYKKQSLSSVYLCTLQQEELKHILDRFEVMEIPCLILKGAISRGYYQKESLRSMGDIDLLYLPEDTKKMQEAMAVLGYKGEGNTTMHDHYQKGVVTVEMHRALCMPEWKESQYFAEIWSRARIKAGYRYVYEMTLEDHYLYTFTHLIEHFQSGGIGIRMVLDVYILGQVDEMNWEYVDRILRELGYAKFHSNIRTLAKMWFGETDSIVTSPELRALERYIMHGGIFGSAENDKVNVQVQYKGGMRFLLGALFPNYQTMQTAYPWLRTRVLLPVAWIDRGVKAVVGRRKNIKIQLGRAKSFGGNRMEVEERKKFFEEIGLS